MSVGISGDAGEGDTGEGIGESVGERVGLFSGETIGEGEGELVSLGDDWVFVVSSPQATKAHRIARRSPQIKIFFMVSSVFYNL